MKFADALVALSLAAFVPLAGAGEIKPYSQAQFDQAATQGRPALVAVHAALVPDLQGAEADRRGSWASRPTRT